MGFRSIRVIHGDFVAPKNGFGMHPHKNMEIISHVISGFLEHKDNMGGVVLRPGEISRYRDSTLRIQFFFLNTTKASMLEMVLRLWRENLLYKSKE